MFARISTLNGAKSAGFKFQSLITVKTVFLDGGAEGSEHVGHVPFLDQPRRPPVEIASVVAHDQGRPRLGLLVDSQGALV